MSPRGGPLRCDQYETRMKSFDEAFRANLRDLLVWRRDVRRFRNEPLPDGALERLIETACLAPSVGLSQPWRFVIVDDPARRQAVIEDFTACNADALTAYAGEKAARYATLKLAGLKEAPAIWPCSPTAEPSKVTGSDGGRCRR